MTLRVGRIPFLVCAPFFHDFLGRESEFSDVEFLDGPPSVHCAGLKNGTIHLSPASSITFAQKPGAFVLSPTLCTSCSFEVRSVKLFSKLQINELNGRRVRMTFQSKTSVNLLRILLEERFGVKPIYVDGTYEEGDGKPAEEDSPEASSYTDLISKRCQQMKDRYRLTSREAEVMEFIVRGYTVSQIAQKFVVSDNTVRTHYKHIYAKMGIHKRQDLITLIESED